MNRRHISLWPSGAPQASPSPSSPSPVSTSTPSDLAPTGENSPWTEDSWSTAPQTQAAAPEGPFTSSPGDLSSIPTSVVDAAQQAVSSPAPPIPTPINPLTNLPIDGNHIGDLVDLGLGGWGPVGLAQNLLEQVHVYTGMPWWGTIVSVSVVTRILLWPLMVKGMGRGARFFDIKDEVEGLVKESQNLGPEEKVRATLQARELMKKHDASPFGTFPPMLAQAAIVFTVFLALERMSHLPLESLKTGGLAWFENLTVPDATYYLPGLASLIFLAGLEVEFMFFTSPQFP